MERIGNSFHKRFLKKPLNNVCRNSKTHKNPLKKETGTWKKTEFCRIGSKRMEKTTGLSVLKVCKVDVGSSVGKDG